MFSIHQFSPFPALSVTVASGVPGAAAPVAGPSGKSGVSLTLTLDNTAAAAGQGSDITAVSSPYSNYVFSAQYLDSGGPTLKGSVFYPTFSASDLRRGIVGGAGNTLTFTGTISYPAIAVADCQTIDKVRFSVTPDSNTGASFALLVAATDLDQDIEITCYPGMCT